MTRTEAIQGTALLVSAADLLDAPAAEEAGLRLERADDPDTAIARLQAGERFDVVILALPLPDPVRVAQRLNSLDRDGALLLVADRPERAELERALAVAPFLRDVTLTTAADRAGLAEAAAASAARTRERRASAAERGGERQVPPPLNAAYLGTLLVSVPIGLVTMDSASTVIGWNKRAGEMLGVPEVEALGMPFTDLFDAGDRSRLTALIERLSNTGIEYDPQVFERDGRAFEMTGARFSARSGGPGALLILQDVTKREAAERELRLQKALTDAQVDRAMAGIVVVSADGSLQRANKRFGEIWGIDEDAMRSDAAGSRAIIHGQVEDPDAFAAGVEALARDGWFHDEVRLRDGRTVDRYAALVRDAAGTLIGQIWFHTDISERKREEDALRFLADATNLLSSSLDYETTLQRIADLAVPRMASWCSVEIVDGSQHRTVAVAHADPGKLQRVIAFRRDYPETDTGAVTRAIATGESQLFRALSAHDVERMARDERHLEILRELGLRSVMIVPIRVRERVFGAINFISDRHSYDDDDLALAEELARRAAIAIDNSSVHAQLRQTARTLQESLLPPHLPSAPGLELAARFRPATADLNVGGDFYDVFDARPGEWVVAVGDVCGKGADAAALTALTRYTVRTAAMYEESPSGVLGVLNTALLHERGDHRFTTLALCVIDVERGVLRAASAGHPRPLLLRADGSVASVGGSGPLLGVMSDTRFADDEIALGAGDTLVLYTDGLTDALAPEQMLDEGDLLTTLADCKGLSAGEISQRLEQRALVADTARAPRDDIAIVVVKVA